MFYFLEIQSGSAQAPQGAMPPQIIFISPLFCTLATCEPTSYIAVTFVAQPSLT